MLKLESAAFERIAILPVAAPLDRGEKVTPSDRLCPAVRVSGRVRLGVVNPAPVVVTREIVTVELPELVSVSHPVCVLPTATVPKLKLPGLVESWLDVTAVPEREIVAVMVRFQLR